jgi:hypothetical protein
VSQITHLGEHCCFGYQNISKRRKKTKGHEKIHSGFAPLMGKSNLKNKTSAAFTEHA